MKFKSPGILHDDRNRLNKNAYDLVARQYAGSEPGEDDPEMRKECRSLFSAALQGKKVLEIGCGPGVDASFLAAEGLDVTASDFCPEFLKIVQERFPFLKTHLMDMTNPDLPEGS